MSGASRSEGRGERIRAGFAYIYDTENPLAWIEAGEVVELERMA